MFTPSKSYCMKPTTLLIRHLTLISLQAICSLSNLIQTNRKTPTKIMRESLRISKTISKDTNVKATLKTV